MSGRVRILLTLLGGLFLFLAPACDEAPGVLDAGEADSGITPALDAGPPPADLDAFIEWQMAYGGLPGVALAIVRPGEVPSVRTYGFADIESGRLVDASTLFIVASISKTIAAVRAMQLVEAGMLDLDAPIATILGYDVVHPGFPASPITSRMLFTHTSGLEDDFITLAEVTYTSDPTMTLAEFTRAYATPAGSLYSAAANWGAEPGTARSYANAGFGIVGDLLERAGGDSFRAQTTASIFEPLAMDGAGWFLADVDAGRLATEYGGRVRFTALPHRGFAFYPASSLRVSITGLARFAAMLLAGGELDGTRVLSAASVDEMFRVQVPEVHGGQALAFSQRRIGGESYIGHSGSTFGASAQLLLSRAGTHGILLLTNSDAYVRSRLGVDLRGDEAMDAILERLHQEAQ